MKMNWNHIKELSPQKIQINLSKVRYISIWNIHRFIGILSIYYIVPSIYHFDIISSGQIDLFSPFRIFPRKTVVITVTTPKPHLNSGAECVRFTLTRAESANRKEYRCICPYEQWQWWCIFAKRLDRIYNLVYKNNWVSIHFTRKWFEHQ